MVLFETQENIKEFIRQSICEVSDSVNLFYKSQAHAFKLQFKLINPPFIFSLLKAWSFCKVAIKLKVSKVHQKVVVGVKTHVWHDTYNVANCWLIVQKQCKNDKLSTKDFDDNEEDAKNLNQIQTLNKQIKWNLKSNLQRTTKDIFYLIVWFEF